MSACPSSTSPPEGEREREQVLRGAGKFDGGDERKGREDRSTETNRRGEINYEKKKREGKVRSREGERRGVKKEIRK